MSVGWDVKWYSVSRITNPSPLARKRLFHRISMKSRLVRAARETSQLLLTNSRSVTWLKYCRYGVKLYSIIQ